MEVHNWRPYRVISCNRVSWTVYVEATDGYFYA